MADGVFAHRVRLDGQDPAGASGVQVSSLSMRLGAVQLNICIAM